MEIREADCCYNCENFMCEQYESFGVCQKHVELEGNDSGEVGGRQVVDFTKVCNDFAKNTSGMKYCRNGKLIKETENG